MIPGFFTPANPLYLLWFPRSVSFRWEALRPAGVRYSSCWVVTFALLCRWILRGLLVCICHAVSSSRLGGRLVANRTVCWRGSAGFVGLVLCFGLWILEEICLHFLMLFELLRNNHSFLGWLRIFVFFCFLVLFLLLWDLLFISGIILFFRNYCSLCFWFLGLLWFNHITDFESLARFLMLVNLFHPISKCFHL